MQKGQRNIKQPLIQSSFLPFGLYESAREAQPRLAKKQARRTIPGRGISSSSFSMCPNALPFPVLLFFLLLQIASAVDFLFNSFNSSGQLRLGRDAWLDSSVIRFTNDSSQSSIGHAFYASPLQMRRRSAVGNSSYINSFSTSFVFSIVSEVPDLPGFGMVFILSKYTDVPGLLPGQYFGAFLNATIPTVTPTIVVEFDTGRNPEFNDPDDNHVGIDFDDILPIVTHTAGYWSGSEFVPVSISSGQNIRAWIDFDGRNLQINVTIAPVGVPRPSRPLVSYTSQVITDYIDDEMFVGFSASKATQSGGTWMEQQRLLAWSLCDEGGLARELNTTNLPVFLSESNSSSSLSGGAVAGIITGVLVLVSLWAGAVYWVRWRRWLRSKEELDKVEDSELDFWPHHFSYEELSTATNGFAKERLLGFGGFGKVHKGVLLRPSSSSSGSEVAVKCIAHDSKQGLKEFKAEISTMGRLQHKNLVPLRGWCRRENELMLVYDYMPNGSLNHQIFDIPDELLGWEGRLRVLTDVAEALFYLHYGWDQMVVHRDIKSSNILLDAEMRAKLGDFGLAKLYQHGQAPDSTRMVGTLGYMAPELARVAAPTTASDMYSFGVVVLEVASGRHAIESTAEEDTLLVNLVRDLHAAGRIREAADERLKGQYGLEVMEKVLKLGLACCHPDPAQRPNIKEVVAVLLGEIGRPASISRG